VTQADLWSVSCANTNSCLTIGTTSQSSIQGVTLRWNGTAWSAATTMAFAGFVPVSCMTATSCETYLFHWNGTSWTHLAKPASDDGWGVTGIACPQVTVCIAVGSAWNGGNPKTVAVRYS
jgi:hypothetical protein